MNRVEFEMLLAQERQKINLVLHGHSGTGVYFQKKIVLLIYFLIFQKKKPKTIYMHIYTYVCLCTCIHIYVCIYAYRYVYAYVYVYAQPLTLKRHIITHMSHHHTHVHAQPLTLIRMCHATPSLCMCVNVMQRFVRMCAL